MIKQRVSVMELWSEPVVQRKQLYQMVGWLKLFNLLAFNQLDLKQIVPTCVQHIHFSLTVFWDFYSISFLDNQRLSTIQETSPFGFKKNTEPTMNFLLE